MKFVDIGKYSINPEALVYIAWQEKCNGESLVGIYMTGDCYECLRRGVDDAAIKRLRQAIDEVES